MHQIRQQYLHVELNGSKSDGMTLQRRLPALCRDWLLPALERTLDRYAPEQGNLYIERLEIDAGAMSLERLEHDLAESVAQALEKALQEQIPADTAAIAEHSSGRVQHKTTRHSVAEAFVFFLETGQLPWSFRLPENRSLEQVVLETWQETEQSNGSQGTEQVRQMLASSSARKRLTRQFTPTLLKTLLARLAPAGAAIMEKMLQALESDKIPPAEHRQVERLLWESVFAGVAAGQSVTAEAIVRDVLPTASVEYTAAAEALARHWPPAAETRHARPPAEPEHDREGKQGDLKVPDAENRTGPETEPSVDAQERPAQALQPSEPSEVSKHPPARMEETPAEKRAIGKPPANADNNLIMPNRDGIAQEEPGEAVQPSAPPASARQPRARQEETPIEEGTAEEPSADVNNTVIMANRDGVAQEEPGEAVQPSASLPSSGHLPAQHRPAAVEETNEKQPSETNNGPFVQGSGDAAQERSAKALPPSPLASTEQISAGQDLADTVAEGIYINNAGLVLLHPFLPQFFGALGIAEENQLLRPERALCLLHFLATGQGIAPEYELMLAKILCNVPLEMPVEADVELTDKEQEEAGGLLTAVIDHWEALRNTSPDGLRGTFLLRSGKISLRGEDLLLQVEPQTWDILLEQLPWGISMIRLPWMDRMLWVEWV